MNAKHFFILLSFLVTASGARGQSAGSDTVLKGSTIEVLQAYKPEVKQAPKPEWIPQLPPPDTTHPALNLEVPQQTLYYSYSSEPLRPLALGKDMPKPPYESYVKAGGGNLSTLFLDAGTVALSSDDLETGIHVHHISQKGSIKNEQTALSGIEAEGLYHADNNEWHVGIQAERNQYAYYGYDHRLYDYPSDSVKQVYTTVRATADMKNKTDSSDKLFYNPALTGSLYDAKKGTSEVTAGLNVPVIYKFDSSLDGICTLTGIITDYKTNTWSSYNNFAQLAPGIRLHHGPMSGHAVLGLALGSDGSGYILPDVLAAFNLPDTKYIVSAGWQATLRRNTYEELSTENPYMLNTFNVTQTRKDEVFFNFSGSVKDHFIFSGRVSWWNFNNLPTFLNDTGDQKQFYIAYDNVKAISFHASVRYTDANKWSLGAATDIYNYYGGSQKYVWQEPNMKLKGDLAINLSSKFMVSMYIALLSGIHARNISQGIVTLNPVTEMGTNAEYQIISRLSAFLQVNNLLNDKYQRWYGYEAYGLNIYGGIRLKF